MIMINERKTVMAHIEVQADGRSKVVFERYTYDGIRKRGSKIFPKSATKAEIKRFMAEKEREYLLQTNSAGTHITLKEFVPVYLEMTDKWHSPSTQASDRSLLYNNKHGIVTVLGECRLENIRLRNIQAYIDSMDGLSSKTKANYLMLIRAILGVARKLEYINFVANPAQDVIIKKSKPREIIPYTVEEARYILKEVDRYNDENTKLIVYLALTCGLRRSEIAGLQIKDIDFDTGVINITHARVSAGGKGDFEKSPKSLAGYRKIYVMDELMKLLKKQRIEKCFNDSAYLLTDDKVKPIKVWQISNKYQTFMNTLNIEYRSLHVLRHTFGSILASEGINVKDLQYMLGHASVVTSMDIYVGSYSENRKKMTENLQKSLFVS